MLATLAAKGWSAADLSKSAAGGGGLVRYMYLWGQTHAKTCTLVSGINVKRISSSSSFSQASFPIELKHDVSSGIALLLVVGQKANGESGKKKRCHLLVSTEIFLIEVLKRMVCVWGGGEPNVVALRPR